MNSSPVVAAKRDAFLAFTFACMCAWALYAANEAAADAVRRYGHNVDSGAYLFMGAILYLGPVALLFALAALLQWRGWRGGRFMHWLAVAGVLAPTVVLAIYRVSGAL